MGIGRVANNLTVVLVEVAAHRQAWRQGTAMRLREQVNGSFRFLDG